jgi:pimeloyl-ACP methyl ester carboxylesterase
MAELQHKFVTTNGIKMHYVEQGSGPLVVLCHGWPESWYSYRHQIPALAAAGFRVVAPDQRGYGQTDGPEPISAYNIFQLTGDIIGLVHALGESEAIIIGHDWGSVVTQYCSLFRPDIFKAVVLLSVPYLPRMRGNTPPIEIMKKMYGEDIFYQVYFQEPGKAEADLDADAQRTMGMILYSNSGSPPPEKRWRFVYKKGETLTQNFSFPDALPGWLTKEDVDYFGREFARSGFRGGLNWYRNIDLNWKETPFLDGAKILQPTLFVAGDVDPVMKMYGKAYQNLEKVVPSLKQKVVLQGVGHWVNQERPAEVNQLILGFLKSL